MERRGLAVHEVVVNTVRQGRMIKPSGSLQDLRSGLYGKRKAERSWHCAEASVGSGGVADGESGSDRISLINPVAKCAGARSAGNPHAACEVAGAGNGATDTAKRARRGKPRIQPSQCPDGPPRQFSTLPTDRMNYDTFSAQAAAPRRSATLPAAFWGAPACRKVDGARSQQ